MTIIVVAFTFACKELFWLGMLVNNWQADIDFWKVAALHWMCSKHFVWHCSILDAEVVRNGKQVLAAQENCHPSWTDMWNDWTACPLARPNTIVNNKSNSFIQAMATDQHSASSETDGVVCPLVSFARIEEFFFHQQYCSAEYCFLFLTGNRWAKYLVEQHAEVVHAFRNSILSSSFDKRWWPLSVQYRKPIRSCS